MKPILDSLTDEFNVMFDAMQKPGAADAMQRAFDSGVPMADFIAVFEFKLAPERLRNLSTSGGDEDWLAIVPPRYTSDAYIPWLESPGFGACDIEWLDDPDRPGWRIAIGSHA